LTASGKEGKKPLFTIFNQGGYNDADENDTSAGIVELGDPVLSGGLFEAYLRNSA
jgi:hypothetical protein